MRTLWSAVLWLTATAPAAAAVPSDLVGKWYQYGDPSRPCYISVVYGAARYTPILTFTDPDGGSAIGAMANANGFAVNRPGPNGYLSGRIVGDPLRNGVIAWDTGAYWTRNPGGP
jgi:hypothetical protein